MHLSWQSPCRILGVRRRRVAIVPTLRCRRIRPAVAFYTRVLDFKLLEPKDPEDPSFCVLTRDGAVIFLSSHAGDGEYGQAVVITVDNVDALAQELRTRGLKTPGDPLAVQEVHEGPMDQTWGTREFYVDDPDGNTIRFVQGLSLDAADGDA